MCRTPAVREQDDTPLTVHLECNILRIAMLTSSAEPDLEGTVVESIDEIRNVVLVHGAFADGSGWRRVHDLLTARGYRVSVVQNPLTSLEADVAATTRVLDLQDGPAILVGHSWGGTVITEAGVHPNVAGLVYVSALAPDAGETTAQQYEGFAPTLSSSSTSVMTATGTSTGRPSTPVSRPMSATPTPGSWPTVRCRSTWPSSGRP